MKLNVLFNFTAKDCREPDIPKYGSLKEGSNNFYFPSIIEYVCNKNYVRIGPESRSCQDNGRWSGRAPSCRAYCGDPGTPSNGKRKGNDFYENGVLDFDCKTGYKISGAKSIKCRQDDASWSETIPTCEGELALNYLGFIQSLVSVRICW